MNRVTTAIEKSKSRLAERLKAGIVTEKQVRELHSELDMEAGEFFRFQELKSHAQLEGKLSLDEAMTIYSLLGNSPDHFNQQPVEVKSVLTQIFGELLEKQVARLKRA